MSVIIVRHPENSTKTKTNKEMMQKKFEQLSRNRNDVRFKDRAEKMFISDDPEVILLGIPVNGTKPKAAYVDFDEGISHFLYHFREDERTVAHLPKGIVNVISFSSDFRIYDSTGICHTFRNPYPGENMNLFADRKNIYVRIGKSHKQKLQEEKDKELAKIGVWRA